MPIEFSIHPDENLIRMKCAGDFTTEELVAHSETVNEHPDFHPGLNTLGDFRDSTWISNVASISSFVGQAKRLEQVRGTCKWALLTDDESFEHLVEMFNTLAHARGVTIESRAFDSEPAALAWLNES